MCRPTSSAWSTPASTSPASPPGSAPAPAIRRWTPNWPRAASRPATATAAANAPAPPTTGFWRTTVPKSSASTTCRRPPTLFRPVSGRGRCWRPVPRPATEARSSSTARLLHCSSAHRRPGLRRRSGTAPANAYPAQGPAPWRARVTGPVKPSVTMHGSAPRESAMASEPTMTRLLMNRNRFQDMKTDTVDAPSAGQGEAVLALDRFSLTINNVTYAAFGDALRYWDFFPTRLDGWGLLPIWGYDDVVASKAD